MSLIKCPECEKEISDKAESCPNCAYPLKKHEETLNDNSKVIVLYSLKVLRVLLFIVILIIILPFVLPFLGIRGSFVFTIFCLIVASIGCFSFIKIHKKIKTYSNVKIPLGLAFSLPLVVLFSLLLILLNYHIYTDGFYFFKKQSMSFSNTFISDEDIEAIKIRYNKSSYQEKQTMQNDLLFQRLIEEKILIFEACRNFHARNGRSAWIGRSVQGPGRGIEKVVRVESDMSPGWIASSHGRECLRRAY